MIQWQVCYADWDSKETNEIEKDGLFQGLPIMAPFVGEVDGRTIKHRVLETEQEAMQLAEEYLARREKEESMDWLAYLEIRKCETETIRKLK